MKPSVQRPLVGVSYRLDIAQQLHDRIDAFDVFEIMVDHYLPADESRRELMRDLVGRVPLVAHGIGLSLGTCGPLDASYLEKVARCVEDLKCLYFSEHVAFTRAGGLETFELLPLPRTLEAAEQISKNINFARSFFDVPFCLENISYYFEYSDAELSEDEFLSLICRETGATILLDVENLYAGSVNFGKDSRSIIDGLSLGMVEAIHIGGGEVRDGVFIDDHKHSIPDGALAVMEYALARHQPRAIIIERDDDLGDGAILVDEVNRVRARLGARSEKRHGESLAW